MRVTVSDNGPGIPPEFCARIFQKFAQADASDSRAKGGTGLGLSIAKTITEKLGGHIGFDTTPGKGTSFYVILPIHGHGSVDAPSRVPSEDMLIEVERGTSRRAEKTLPHILHVEDDQSLTAIVREALSHNAIVTSATIGRGCPSTAGRETFRRRDSGCDFAGRLGHGIAAHDGARRQAPATDRLLHRAMSRREVYAAPWMWRW